jgi:hypothetical protein
MIQLGRRLLYIREKIMVQSKLHEINKFAIHTFLNYIVFYKGHFGTKASPMLLPAKPNQF